jgi:hypothetical protein
VTGFGLLGHLHNLCRAGGVAAVIDAGRVPAIDGALELLDDAGEPAVSGGSRRNREYAATFTTFAGGVPAGRRRLLCDATTSGGLLVAVAEDRAALVPAPGRGAGRGGRGRHNPRAVNEYVERPGPGGPPGLQNRGERGRPRWKVRLLRRSV